MTGFEPATTRPPAVYANRTAPHPEYYFITTKTIVVYGFQQIKKTTSGAVYPELAEGPHPEV